MFLVYIDIIKTWNYSKTQFINNTRNYIQMKEKNITFKTKVPGFFSTDISNLKDKFKFTAQLYQLCTQRR